MAVGNLEFIKSFESTTSSSSYNIDDMFTPNYDVFKVVIKELQTAGSSSIPEIRFRDNTPSTISTSNYDDAFLRMRAYTTFEEQKGTNKAQFRGLAVDPQTTAESGGFVMYVFNPTDTSSYTFVTMQGSYVNTDNGFEGSKSIAVLKTTDDVRGMAFFFTVGNIDGLSLSVYGVK